MQKDQTPNHHAKGPRARRVCLICGIEKPVTGFHRFTRAGEYYPECKGCTEKCGPERLSALATGAPPPAGTRRCRHCLEVKPLEDFVADRRAREGRRPGCQSCQDAGRTRCKAAPSLKVSDAEFLPNSRLRLLRVALGIAIARATCPPGHCRSLEEIAAYADTTPEAIRAIERKAMAKLRTRLGAILRKAGLGYGGGRP